MEHGLLDTDSVDLVLTDLPYGVTQNKWDSVIPLDFLWGDWFRIGKERCPFVLFGQDKFSAKLMLSQVKYHKYNLIWNKVITSGFLNANSRGILLKQLWKTLGSTRFKEDLTITFAIF